LEVFDGIEEQAEIKNNNTNNKLIFRVFIFLIKKINH